MSIVSDHTERRISSMSLMRFSMSYIPIELLNTTKLSELNFGFLDFVEDNGEKLLQWLMENSNQRLRMYGSARELASNVKVYRSCTGSMDMIDADIIEPYSTLPTVYCSLSNKEYICKQDIFVHLQDLLLKKFPDLECIVSLSMILIFLKTREARLNSCFEFVRYDQKEFEKLEKEIDALGVDMNAPNSAYFPKSPLYKLKLKKYTFHEIFTQWKTINPSEWNQMKYGGIEAILKSVVEEVNPRSNPLFYKHRFYNLNIIISGLQRIIDKRPRWFLPNDENCTDPVQLRLFEDNGEQFVMVMEVYEKVERTSNVQLDEFSFEGDDSICGWQSITYEQMKRKFPKQCQNIEFIRTPVLRAKHRAVPIIRHDGEHTLLAADVLFELLRRMIFGAKVFQRAKKNNGIWKVITNFFERIDHYFRTKLPIFFFEYETIAIINKEFDNCFSKYLEKQAPPVKEIRNAKKDGFTLQNLVNELNNLTLPDAFPDITDYAEIVYQHVLKNKKEEFLRTCDLFDAVEFCQIICIFKKFPKLAEFVHSQKACYRIPSQCELCSSEAKDHKNKEAREKLFRDGEAQFDFAGAIVNARVWDPKKSFEENTQCSTCDDHHASSHIEQKETPAEKSSVQHKQNKPKSSCGSVISENISNTSMKSQKPSESCKTCSETVEMFNKIKKEIVTSYNETETFKKKMIDAESELASLKKKSDVVEESEEKKKTISDIKREEELQLLKSQIADAKQNIIDIEKSRQKEEKSFDKSRSQLTEFNLKLEKQLNEEEQKSRLFKQEIESLQDVGKVLTKQLEESLSEQNRLKFTVIGGENIELHEQNMRLAFQLEEREKTIDSLLDKLSTSSN